MTDNYKQQETSIKSLNDSLKAQKNAHDIEIAVLTQRLEFSDESLRDTRQQLADAKINHEAAVLAMKEASGRLKEESEN